MNDVETSVAARQSGPIPDNTPSILYIRSIDALALSPVYFQRQAKVIRTGVSPPSAALNNVSRGKSCSRPGDRNNWLEVVSLVFGE
jgi:hypothetical protein